MLRFISLVALALLMASWEVTGNFFNPEIGAKYFGCFKNVDAICSCPSEDGQHLQLRWAERLHPKKRDYRCLYGHRPECCAQGVFKRISDADTHFINVLPEEISGCSHDGQHS
ncbi:hypothetical protein KEM48_004667 [Puccinia striiformis f. sp. tritici PST-130]|nr:hypothetical protein KEM48_004667 [Puccinia striiformis f. sp. tritici PST-130]